MAGVRSEVALRDLLLSARPLVVRPELAVVIGLNEAIVLQQMQYWLLENEREGRSYHDGYYWTYNSYRAWQDQFPFWSQKTIKRTIATLEKRGLLISGVFNKSRVDRTKWYRIDFTQTLSVEGMGSNCPHAMGQNDPMQGAKTSPSNQRLTTEINTETNNHEVYGEFGNVLLTDTEYQKLQAKLDGKAGDLIERLSGYMASKGKRYKSHYATLLNWQRRDEKSGKTTNPRALPRQYTESPDYADL